MSRRVPNNDVILVATKGNLAGGNAWEISRRMEKACRRWLSSWARNGMLSVRLEPGVCLTSCFPIGVSEPARVAVKNSRRTVIRRATGET
ncbi:unnamed protein product [Ectocarpus sp. 4 AP-2014]